MRPAGPTQFKLFYDRGDFPIGLVSSGGGNSIQWSVGFDKLDYHHYLPLFFDGLRETKHPYDFFAERGCLDMMTAQPDRVLQVVPQLIIPIKKALNTRDRAIVCRTLKILQELVKCAPMVGEALVPYYRQILPILNLFKNDHEQLGDGIAYSQRKRQNIGDLIEETLQIFELSGGENAYINIKCVPSVCVCVCVCVCVYFAGRPACYYFMWFKLFLDRPFALPLSTFLL